MKKVTNGQLINDLKLTIDNLATAQLDREVTAVGVHRLGLELAGVYESTHSELQIVGWGTKESKWLAGLGKVKARETLMRVLVETTPLIILSGGVASAIRTLIIDVASIKGIPVISLAYHLSYAMSTVNWYLAKKLAPSINVHGSLVVVYGVGVMIIGPSGIGKSEAVLELIQDGQLFISDDTVTVTQIGNDFAARSAVITKGYLEARGIGLIDIQHMYGAQTVKDETLLQLVVELVPGNKMNSLDRLGEMNLTHRILAGEIPKIQIPVERGRNIAALIKAATGAFISRQHGINALTIINERIDQGEEE